jgi:protein-serine/threonine kinase
MFMISQNRLITSSDRRLNVEQMRKHHFFYGVDWETIRHIDSPFVPHLSSITDTSYFPTEELEQVPDEPVGGDTSGAHKELAFLGSVFLFYQIPETIKIFHRYTFKRFTVSSNAF